MLEILNNIRQTTGKEINLFLESVNRIFGLYRQAVQIDLESFCNLHPVNALFLNGDVQRAQEVKMRVGWAQPPGKFNRMPLEL